MEKKEERRGLRGSLGPVRGREQAGQRRGQRQRQRQRRQEAPGNRISQPCHARQTATNIRYFLILHTNISSAASAAPGPQPSASSISSHRPCRSRALCDHRLLVLTAPGPGSERRPRRASRATPKLSWPGHTFRRQEYTTIRIQPLAFSGRLSGGPKQRAITSFCTKPFPTLMLPLRRQQLLSPYASYRMYMYPVRAAGHQVAVAGSM